MNKYNAMGTKELKRLHVNAKWNRSQLVKEMKEIQQQIKELSERQDTVLEELQEREFELSKGPSVFDEEDKLSKALKVISGSDVSKKFYSVFDKWLGGQGVPTLDYALSEDENGPVGLSLLLEEGKMLTLTDEEKTFQEVAQPLERLVVLFAKMQNGRSFVEFKPWPNSTGDEPITLVEYHDGVFRLNTTDKKGKTRNVELSKLADLRFEEN